MGRHLVLLLIGWEVPTVLKVIGKQYSVFGGSDRLPTTEYHFYAYNANLLLSSHAYSLPSSHSWQILQQAHSSLSVMLGVRLPT